MQFCKGFLVGLVVTLLAVSGAVFFSVLPQMQRTATAQDAAAAAQQAALELLSERAESCEARFTEWTTLYEFDPAKVEVLDGLVELRAGSAMPMGSPVLRWGIPARVTPFVYGDTRGVAYAWWNPRTGKLDGPHAPETAR